MHSSLINMGIVLNKTKQKWKPFGRDRMIVCLGACNIDHSLGDLKKKLLKSETGPDFNS